MGAEVTMTFALKPYVPYVPSIPRPPVVPNYNRPRPPVIINNHYYGGGYGGGFYHPWYHPVFVMPTYGNYVGGSVGGVEQFVVVLLVLAIVGLLGYSAYKLLSKGN